VAVSAMRGGLKAVRFLVCQPAFYAAPARQSFAWLAETKLTLRRQLA